MGRSDAGVLPRPFAAQAGLTAQLDKLQGGGGEALQQELAYLKERLEA